MKVHEAIIEVMKDVGAVKKGDRNDFHKFSFRGIDATVNALSPALRKHGVTVRPSNIISCTYEKFQTAKGGISLTCRLLVEFTFVGPEGDSITSVVAAEAADTGDKPLALDTPVLTAHGWTTMADIQEGDTVFDMEGKPARVALVSEIKNDPCMKVTLRNGESFVATEDHDWWARVHGGELQVLTTRGLFDHKRKGHKVALPGTPPIDRPAADLPIDPWILGYWLGNGTSDKPQLTIGGWEGESDIDFVESRVETAGYSISSFNVRRPGTKSIYLSGLREGLKKLNVWKNKHIPDIYMRAGVEQRRELLRGLMDSDGCASGGTALFVSSSERLAKDVHLLARSLGEGASVWEQAATGFGIETTVWRVKFTPCVNPFSLPRKARDIRIREKATFNAVASVEPVDPVPTRCIRVESDTSSFLIGKDLVPTHNSTPKAMSVAFRTALLQTFALPTDEVDPDAHSYEHQPAKPTAEQVIAAANAAETKDAARQVYNQARAAGCGEDVLAKIVEIAGGKP